MRCRPKKPLLAAFFFCAQATLKMTEQVGLAGGVNAVDTVSRVSVYVDGFNLYYRALKGTKYKWLNIEALCQSILHKTPNITAINYYTARVKQLDPSYTDQADQAEYIRALSTLPNLKIHYGNFQVTEKVMRLASPLWMRPEFDPAVNINACTVLPEVARVIKTEEKGSDVNLGVHLVRDAFTNKFDIAVVITNDTDLTEPLRIVLQESGKKLVLLSPVSNPAGSLTKILTGNPLFINSSHLAKSQFPSPHVDKKGRQIFKPSDW